MGTRMRRIGRGMRREWNKEGKNKGGKTIETEED